MGDRQVENICELLDRGVFHAGSDGFEKDGIGSHVYGSTSSKENWMIWGGYVTTPGNVDEISSLWAELRRS